MFLLPRGDGHSAVKWVPKVTTQGFDANAPLLDQTAYHSPVRERKYTARIELIQDTIRVYLDGGLLLKAKAPAGEKASELPVFLGLSQVYDGRTKIHAVRVYEIDGSQPR